MISHRLLGATALASTLLVVSPAFGQAAPTPPNPATTPQDAEAQVDPLAVKGADGETSDDGTILVTGSRIPRPELNGVLPGVQVGAEQIQARAFTNALEAINDIPLVGPGASPLNGNNGGQAASLGAAFVDLLDLGTSRTLTLVNGRRYVSGNAASLFVEGNSTGSQVDINTIPASLISRVDVVTVGGAAAYGSDAIAGVVNFILKDDYDGIEVGGLGGISSRGDAGGYQLHAVVGQNFMDGRANITIAGEYDRADGLMADARNFRLDRFTTVTNFANGAVRNSAFASAIINPTTLNNGAFLRNTDDGVPATAYSQQLINQTISFGGTILNTIAAPPAYYTPLSQTVNGVVRTSNFIALQNGLGTIGANGLPFSTPLGNATPINQAFFSTVAQLIQGTPGVPITLGNLSGNGLNGRTTAAAGLPITTFAPTALPTGVTAAQVFTQFGVTPPAAATPAEQNTLAINVLQANRPTAREFFAANPNVNANLFIGTFIPNIPRIANTDTTLVNVRSSATGAVTQVPLNQVLPFVAVPLEFTPDGNVRNYTAATLTPTQPGLISQSPGSNGGFTQGFETISLRTQQDRYIGNLIAKIELSDSISLFTENVFSHIRNVTLENQASNNSISTSNENAPLVLNVTNPYLDAGDRAALAAVGITSAVNGGTFALTRINQDIFGNNPFTNTSDTYRLVGGARADFRVLGQDWKAEISGTYGHSKATTRTTSLLDIEYQLALDAVDQGLATTGVANGRIVCRAQVFPTQYLGRTPNGTVPNVTRLPGAGGIPTEAVSTPVITQGQIDACQPLNPFGFNQMSDASKAYVRADTTLRNIGTQTFIQGSVSGGLFNLPAGTLAVAGSAEYRRETLAFISDPINQVGRTRSAPSASTQGEIEVYEFGGEARIPIFGEDFLSFFGTLELNPAVRISKQTGSSTTYRNIAGALITPESKGKFETIYSLAATWKPIRDIQLRGNYTRSIRQPSIVELFLGGQSAFQVATDPCGPANITGGSSATQRRANCQAAVIATGVVFGGAPVTTATQADAFLSTYIPLNISLPGTFSGANTLQPERAKSYTFGGVLTPRFLPNLTLSADYIAVDLANVIIPAGVAQGLNFCFDSATFPDTSPQTGVNTCNFFTRGADFQINPGFAAGFLNLSATELRAINISGDYRLDLGNLGRLKLRASAYHLIRYTESAAGDFTDRLDSAGTFLRPKWEVQVAPRYENGGFFTQLSWGWREATQVFANGAPATIENVPAIDYPESNIFDLVVGADVNDNFRIQFNVQNLTDENYTGDIGRNQANYIDQIGRRFVVSTNVKF